MRSAVFARALRRLAVILKLTNAGRPAWM